MNVVLITLMQKEIKVTNGILLIKTKVPVFFLVSCSLGLTTLDVLLVRALRVETFPSFILCSTREFSLTSLDKIK